MSRTLKDLNIERKSEYQKDRNIEDFFQSMNSALQTIEKSQYRDFKIKHPFLFVIGLPRSGTTLLSQILAYSLDVGYINNLMSRFWLAPLHGIRLSKNLIGEEKKSDFNSNYARTSYISDIHEFGYFWRYWLKKETFDDVTYVKEREKNIDWKELRKVLSTIQVEFNKTMIFKNIFGSYHMLKLKNLLQKVLYIYIERDTLDVAISILEARKKYYEDLNTWWSYQPIEYEQIKNMDYWHQIAGQIYFLKRFYAKQAKLCGGKYVLKISYKTLCTNPMEVLELIQEHIQSILGYELKIVHRIKTSFPYRVYSDRSDEKEKFNNLLGEFKKTYGELL